MTPEELQSTEAQPSRVTESTDPPGLFHSLVALTVAVLRFTLFVLIVAFDIFLFLMSCVDWFGIFKGLRYLLRRVYPPLGPGPFPKPAAYGN